MGYFFQQLFNLYLTKEKKAEAMRFFSSMAKNFPFHLIGKGEQAGFMTTLALLQSENSKNVESLAMLDKLPQAENVKAW